MTLESTIRLDVSKVYDAALRRTPHESDIDADKCDMA